MIDDFADKKISKSKFEGLMREVLRAYYTTFKGDDVFYLNFMLQFESEIIMNSDTLAYVKFIKDTKKLPSGDESYSIKNVIGINPIIFAYGKQVCKYLLKHEILHIVFNHFTRGTSLKHKKLWNYATDCTINQLIDVTKNEGKFTSALEITNYLGGITVDSFEKLFNLHSLEHNQHADYYYIAAITSEKYDEMMQQKQKNKKDEEEFREKIKEALSKGQQEGNDSSEDNESNGSGEGDSSEEESQEQQVPEKQYKGKNLSKVNSSKDIDWSFSASHDTESSSAEGVLDDEETQPIIDGIVNRSTDCIPSQIMDAIRKWSVRRRNWKKELSFFFATLADGKKKTFQRRDRRFAHILYMRGTLTDRTLNIGVVIDTSGSIVDYAGNFLQEIYHMSKDYGTIEIAEVDTQVNNTYMFNPNKIPSKSHGGGGTILEPGIEYFYDGKETNKKDVIVIFTDGYCENSIKKPKGNVPIVWVVLDNVDNLAVKQPFGKVIPFDRTI